MAQYHFVYQKTPGVTRRVIADRDTPDEFTTHTQVELDEILKGIDRDRDLLPARQTNRVLARVPLTVYEQSLHEKWDDVDWKKFLNDPANEPFRVWRGRV